MKKNDVSYCLHWQWDKLLLIMKLVWILILVGMVGANAKTFSQNVRLDLKSENASLKAVLSQIEEKTNYYFFYKSEDIETLTNITIDAKQKLLSELLEDILKNKGFKYEVHDHYILIQKANENNTLTDLMQQQKTVTGRVTDSSGTPLPGVSVVVKGTTKGVITDNDGNYSIGNLSDKSNLEFSFIGMQPQSILVGSKTTINVSLAEATVGLDEVVAIGYGTTSKRKTVSAISTIQSDKLQNIPVPTIGDRLAGRTSGLIVTSSGGGPGKLPTVSVRGGGTPLVVIDGIVASMTDLQNLNANDIESFSILKDAEAAAIYGARAGNGIVMVTTKRGEQGKMNIRYEYSHNLAQPTILPKKLGSYDRVLIANEARKNDGQAPAYTDAVVQKYKDQSDPYNYPNTDWQKVCLNTFAPTSRHNLTIDGGNDKTKYFASIGSYDQGTLYVFNTNWMKRYNYRLSITNKFDKIGLTANANIFGVLQKVRYPISQYATGGYWQTWGHIQNSSPMEIAYTDLGLYSGKGDHPLVEIDPNSGYDLTETRNLNGILDLAWDVPWVKGLKIKAINHYRLDNQFRKTWNATANQYGLGSTTPITHNAPQLFAHSENGYSYTNQFYGEYNRTFAKDHTIAATFGYEQSYSNNQYVEARRINYQILFDEFIAGPTLNSSNGGGTSESGRAGFIGRLRYDYKGKYYAEGSIRRDGSDWFPKDKRWGTFWSGSAGWVISEETFMKDLNDQNILNFLKLRGSWGVVGLDGSDAGISRFQYIPGYNITERGYLINNSFVQGFTEGPLVSPDLTWYSQSSRNIGFEFSTLKSKLSGSFDYFYLKTTGYLASLSGSMYTDPLGISLPTRKTNGEFRRAGFEISASYKGNVGKLNYEISGNMTRFDQLWANKPDEDQATLKNPYTRQTQQTGYYGIGYLSDGFYSSADDILNSPKYVSATNLVPGDIKYKDINGDGRIDSQDQTRIGKNSFPRMNYGIGIDLRYGAWFLNTLIQGSGNRDIYPGDVIRNNQVYTFQTDYWTPSNTNAKYPRLMSSPSYNGSNNTLTSDFWLTNGRYIRLKSMQLGYDFKAGLLKKLPFVSELSCIFSGSNLITLSPALRRYKMDPEVGDTNNYDYPAERVYSLTVRVGF